ncbi:hypothetical protein FNO01nite_27660 [Flavobacterium noncentrifugens]|nr:hypothetical protein FNO01nite_27660 [Flavobacterium noncentrifugens]
MNRPREGQQRKAHSRRYDGADLQRIARPAGARPNDLEYGVAFGPGFPLYLHQKKAQDAAAIPNANPTNP